MFKLLSALLLSATLVGCGSTPNPVAQLDAAINNYKRVNATHKAMAVGYAPNGHWVAGWIYTQPDEDTAARKALDACREQSLKYGATHNCRIVFLNNDFQNQPAAATRSETPTPTPTNPPAPAKKQSTGSGVFIDASGTILTAHHVVSDASSIEVVMRDGQRRTAKIESASRTLDIAVLKVDYESKSFIPLKNVVPAAGSRVFTVGFPVPGLLGQEPKVSEGIISALSGIRDDASFMQISIPIQPGNSGGPVLTERGELVGVVSSTAAVSNFLKRTGTLPQSVNWAVRASMALPLIGVEQKGRNAMTREAAVKEAIAASVMIISTE